MMITIPLYLSNKLNSWDKNDRFYLKRLKVIVESPAGRRLLHNWQIMWLDLRRRIVNYTPLNADGEYELDEHGAAITVIEPVDEIYWDRLCPVPRRLRGFVIAE